MNDDNDGIVDDPRSGQRSKHQKFPDGFEVVEEAVAEGDSEKILELVGIAKMSSGIIPLAEDLNQYRPEVQAKIIEWADAQIKANVVDESIRQDKLVDGELIQAKYGQVLSMIIMLFLVVAAVVAVFIINNAWAATPFLAVQFFTIGANLLRPIRSKSSGQEENKD